MRPIYGRLLGLCLPPLLTWAADISLTLAGQPPPYWAGNFAAVNEASPTFHGLLAIHPLAFVLGAAAWAGIFVAVILLLPDAAALIVSIAVTLGHAAGAATWLLWRFHFGYQLCNALFLAVAVALGIGIRYGWQAAPPARYELAGWPFGRRLAIAAVLFAVAVYLFLWPRTP